MGRDFHMWISLECVGWGIGVGDGGYKCCCNCHPYKWAKAGKGRGSIKKIIDDRTFRLRLV